MFVSKRIKLKLQKAFDPCHLDLRDESDKHQRGSESHFSLLLVSDFFKGLSNLERQRCVYQVLNEEFLEGFHSLSQTILTRAEWEQRGLKHISQTPSCFLKNQGDSGGSQTKN